MYEIKQPFHSGYLQVSEIHQIYWEESGNPDGVPVIFFTRRAGRGGFA